MTTPLISNLYDYYHQPKIDILLKKGTEEILENNPFVKEILTYNQQLIKRSSLFQKITTSYNLIRRIRTEKYDLLIDLDDGDKGAFLSKFSGAKRRIGYDNERGLLHNKSYDDFLKRKREIHIVDQNLQFLDLLSIPKKFLEVTFHVSNTIKKDMHDKAKRIGKFIHLHPFSQGEYKNINSQITSEIIDFCYFELKIPVVLTSSKSKYELKILRKILRNCNSSPIVYGGTLNLEQIAALNSKAILFVGADTAIMHISAANNTPTIGVFGPSNPSSWGPWDNQFGANYEKRGGLQINNIHTVISEDKDCVPCNNLGCNNSRVSHCLDDLNKDLIKFSIKKWVVSEDLNT